MAPRCCAQNASISKSSLSRLSGGLPANVDYSVLKTAADAKALILILPSCDRGEAAVGLYRREGSIGADVAYSGLMAAWDHDHRAIIDAFGSPECFVAALKNVAPPHGLGLRKRIDVWRGIVTDRHDPFRGPIGLSWTRSRSVAYWFVLHDYVPALQPSLVAAALHANIDQPIIIAGHNERSEREAILDADRLVLTGCAITLGGSTLILGECRERPIDFRSNETVFDALLPQWRLASARDQHWKGALELRRSLAAHSYQPEPWELK